MATRRAIAEATKARCGPFSVFLLSKACKLCTAVRSKALQRMQTVRDKQEPEVVFLVGAVHVLERSAEDVRRVIEVRTVL
jgi:hypothetical protein